MAQSARAGRYVRPRTGRKVPDGSHPPNTAPWVSPQRCRRRSIWRPNPRWNRFYGTFGEDPDLDTDMARAYIDGFQTSVGAAEIADGWGYESVNAMVKHWPGGGPEEGGRDAHFSFGKYTVYPGGNFEQHIRPFVEGAFRLNGKTRKAAAVMPYYTGFPTGWTPREKRSATVLANISSPICCGTDTDTTASSARIGASRTTIPASRRLTANAGEWRH